MNKDQQEQQISITFDRLTLCYNDPNPENVEGTLNLLMSAKYQKCFPGMTVKPNARYKFSCRIPLPSDGVYQHPVCFEAGPRQPKTPSYRLDFNPSKITPEGMDDLAVLLSGYIDPTPKEFFSLGRVTRADLAINLPNLTLDDVILRSSRKRKHGVYTDQSGKPQTIYLGTPRSKRTVAYDKPTGVKGTTALRIECREKPNCFGYELLELANPFKEVEIYPVSALEKLKFGFPVQMLADSMRMRGIRNAIACLGSTKRQRVLKALNNSPSLLPDANELWASWREALTDVGIGKLIGFDPIATACATPPSFLEAAE